MNKALSPMPGTISKIFVKIGELLKRGDPIFAMEAMKMEHVIRASRPCTVK
jgi:biotin carboxyl carrier protein